MTTNTRGRFRGWQMRVEEMHEATGQLESTGHRPRMLVTRDREAPGLPGQLPGYADDASLLARCRKLGGVPDAVLNDPELPDFLLAPLRADVAMLEAHDMLAAPRVTTPIPAYLGADDAGCTPARLTGWTAVTTGPFHRRLPVGDHFSVLAHPGELLRDLCARV